MSKLSKQQKLEIYRKWKLERYSISSIARELHLGLGNLSYLVHLIDLHGTQILDQSYHKYSKEFKEAAIARALSKQESIEQVSLQLGLKSCGMLNNWLREYKKNGYNVVIKKKGRPSAHEQGSRDRALEERKPRTQGEKLRAAYRKCLYKKIKRLGSETSQELAQAITELRQEERVSLDTIFKALSAQTELPVIARSTYYYTISKAPYQPKCPKLIDRIKEIFAYHKGRYGYRRIALQLIKEGWNITEKTVRYWMHKLGLRGIRRNKRKYSSYKGTIGKIAPNLIKRKFFAPLPNMKWYTDITEFHLHNKKLYLSPILDGCDGSIVSYSISEHPDMHLVMSMLNKAFIKETALNNCVLHTDQGCQYQSPMYQRALKLHSITQSMSRKGNSIDDGLMENFFGLLKTEMFYDQEYKYHNLHELKEGIEEYIEYYNNERIKSRLKGATPIEYRNHALNNPMF